MKRVILRKEKGITLIALIITVIILVLLAAVSLRVLLRSGLINKTIGSAAKYKDEMNTEIGLIEQLRKQVTKYDIMANNRKVSVTDSVVLDKEPSNWTNGDVTITVSYEDIPEGYRIQYKI